MTREEHLRMMLSNKLMQYVPEATIPLIVNWMMEYKIHLTLTPQRSSKYGDYRHPHGNKGHRISVNKNLNRFAFLITLVHEVAHLKCWMKHRNSVAAHGQEWKMIFTQLLIPFIELHIFPDDVKSALIKYAQSPAASTCSDERLMRALANYNRIKLPRVEELAEEALFRTINGRLFQKGEVIRKRIRCVEVHTKRTFLFHPLAEVVPNENFEIWIKTQD